MQQERRHDADEIFRARKQWKKVKPDLNTSPMETVGRILRIEFLFRARMRQTAGEHGIDPGGLDVLGTLRRSGPPYRMTPSQLYRGLVLTSGAMTHRMDALEKAGLLERHPDPQDRRSITACLTPKGRQVIDKAMADHMQREAEIVACLTAQERNVLADLLRKILLSMEKAK